MSASGAERRLHLLSTLLETSVDLHRIQSPRALAKLAARTLQGQFGVLKVALYEEKRGVLKPLIAPGSGARALRGALERSGPAAGFPTVVRAAGRGRTLITALSPSLTGATLGKAEIAFVESLSLLLLARLDQLDFVQSQRERLRLQEQMSLAREIQRDLLPRIPDVPGWDLEWHFGPLHEVGGDVVDLDLCGDTLRMALGDVSGKGAGAALLMAHLLAAVRAAWQACPGQPARALGIVSDALYKSTTSNRYASLVLCEVDLRSGAAVFCNGGHPFPLLASSAGARWLKTGGIPAGMVEGFAYQEERVTLGSGDGILFVTDGVFEARREPAEGWRDFYAEHLAGGFANLRGRLAKRATERSLKDDETLLWLRRKD